MHLGASPNFSTWGQESGFQYTLKPKKFRRIRNQGKTVDKVDDIDTIWENMKYNSIDK